MVLSCSTGKFKLIGLSLLICSLVGTLILFKFEEGAYWTILIDKYNHYTYGAAKMSNGSTDQQPKVLTLQPKQVFTSKDNNSKEDKEPKLVLIYNGFFGSKPWPGVFSNNDRFIDRNNLPCRFNNCRISYDTNDLHKSDAVMFHGRDIGGADLIQLSKSVARRATQRWVYFVLESPIFSGISDFNRFDNVFNWTMTFKLSSDIFFPYHSYFPHETMEGMNETKDYAAGKDKLVAWSVSHCGRLRDKFVRKLMKFISVDIYGGCSSKFSQNKACRRGDKGCTANLRRYKFVLALENSNCVDYITEKYWNNGLEIDVVPVVLGGGNYSDSNLAIPGSFINALDFPSVKSLADYLLMLDKNDTAYNEYFAWKKFYHIGWLPWPCKMCAMLNDATLPKKSYSSAAFKEFYGVDTNCGFQDKRIEQMVAP